MTPICDTYAGPIADWYDDWVRWYWKDEFLKLLAAAGFSNVQALTDSSLYQEGHVYFFRAHK